MATKAMYQKVTEGDEESAESLLENRTQPISHSPRQKPYQSLIQKLNQIKGTIITHPFTSIVTILLCLSFSLNVFAWHRAIQIANETVPTRELQYGRDIRYMSLHHKYDHLWNRISSDHSGMIRYHDADEPEREAPMGVMSMFHQLHCVASLRNALQNAYFGIPVAFDQEENSHWPHCLDYLRKSILCLGDETIEREKVINGTRSFKIDGIMDTRQCKDTTHLYDLLRTNGLPDSKGPLGDLDDNKEINWWINS